MEKSLGADRVSSKGLGGRRIWDANSSLYDTFELNSFRRQLDAAIISSARSQSMPHLSVFDRRPLPQQQQAKSTTTTTAVSRKSTVFRSLNKFLRSFLRHKANSNKVNKFDAAADCADKFGEQLSTIHEYPEWGYNNGFPFEEFDDSNFKNAKKTSDDSIIFNKSKFDEDFIIVKKLPSDRLTSTNAIGISLM